MFRGCLASNIPVFHVSLWGIEPMLVNPYWDIAEVSKLPKPSLSTEQNTILSSIQGFPDSFSKFC